MSRLDYVGNRLHLNPKLAREQEWLKKIKNLLTKGDRIGAIKIYRDFHKDAGLKEAKDEVEQIENGLKPRRCK